MKTVIFWGTHKTFSGVRLGAALGTVLAGQGHEVLLVGAENKLPTYVALPMVVITAKTTVKILTSFLQKQQVERVISLAYLPGCAATEAAKIPFVYAEPENLKESEHVKNKKALLAKATRVLVIGPGEEPLNKKIYGTNAVRVTNPAIWVEHSNYNKPTCFKKANNIVAAGTFDKYGGFKPLLQAWAYLAPLHPSWHLTLVGAGAGRATLQKYITQQNLTNSTEIVGPETDLYALLRSADIYVNPAATPAGLESLVDAMASKLPVITTDVAGTEKLVQSGIDGIVVPVGDQAQLTGALDRLMVDWGYRVSLAVHASQLREKFSFIDFALQVFDD